MGIACQRVTRPSTSLRRRNSGVHSGSWNASMIPSVAVQPSLAIHSRRSASARAVGTGSMGNKLTENMGDRLEWVLCPGDLNHRWTKDTDLSAWPRAGISP